MGQAMKSPFFSLIAGGILAIIIGFVFIGRSSYQSGQNDEFLERGLLREGRVVSHQSPASHSDYALRLKTNVSPEVTGTDVKILEVEVKKGDFEKAPVGAFVKIVLIPGDPPRARLTGSAQRSSHRFGYVYASLSLCIGAILLWLAWRHKTFGPQEDPIDEEKVDETDHPPIVAAVSDIMEKQIIKDPILYDGAFEFSYSTEKNSVELKDGTKVRVSQYRPIRDLPKVLADKDLLHILRTAESPWQIADTIRTGQLALSHLLKEKHATEADQFFVNGPYLGLLYRDEIDTGRWHAIVRGIWRITPLSHTLSHLVSSQPDLAREAAFDILHHPDLSLIASLAPGLPIIRGALQNIPQTGEFSDNRRLITRAADIIDSLSQGNCYCLVYAQTSDPPYTLIEKKKFALESGRKGDQKIEISCTHCKKHYTLTQNADSHLPHYIWEEKK